MLTTAPTVDGSRRLKALLEGDFGPLARNTVRCYMQEMGIAAVYPGPNISKRHADHQVYPYLLRHVTATHANHIWGVDITYVRLHASGALDNVLTERFWRSLKYEEVYLHD